MGKLHNLQPLPLGLCLDLSTMLNKMAILKNLIQWTWVEEVRRRGLVALQSLLTLKEGISSLDFQSMRSFWSLWWWLGVLFILDDWVGEQG
jgi:hypothetical protein